MRHHLCRRAPALSTGTALIATAALTVTLCAAAPSGSWTAPASAAARVNPLEGRAELAAGGQKLFADKCAACHGHDGSGTGRAPDLRIADVQAQTDGALFWKITQGNTRTGMPTFSYLPEPQRWQLVLQLRRLPTRDGIEPSRDRR